MPVRFRYQMHLPFGKALMAFLLCLLLSVSCKKKNTTSTDEVTPAATASQINAPDLTCAELPPAPIPFGWTDSSASADKCINAFFFNPVNANEIIYVANGDLFGYNKMYCYNIPAKQTTYLSSNGNFLPQVNKQGWIVFNLSDLNIYKIKTNGDSAAKLTTNNSCSDPHWNYQGDRIFYYQTALGNLPDLLVEMDRNGNVLNTIPTQHANTALARTGNRSAYLRSEGSTVSVYYKDLATNSETFVISQQGSIATFQNLFNYLTFDNTDENLYWSNSAGIFRCNIANPKIDTLLKNCANITYDRPMVTANRTAISFACHLQKPISSIKMLHQYKALEMEPATKRITEVRIFP